MSGDLKGKDILYEGVSTFLLLMGIAAIVFAFSQC